MTGECNIEERYSIELDKIDMLLEQLQAKRVYEITGCKADGSITLHANRLLEQFHELFKMIQYGSPSMNDQIKRAFEEHNS